MLEASIADGSCELDALPMGCQHCHVNMLIMHTFVHCAVTVPASYVVLQLTTTCDSLNWFSMEAMSDCEVAQSTSCSSADFAAWATVVLSHCRKSTSDSSAVNQ